MAVVFFCFVLELDRICRCNLWMKPAKFQTNRCSSDKCAEMYKNSLYIFEVFKNKNCFYYLKYIFLQNVQNGIKSAGMVPDAEEKNCAKF